MSDDTHHAVELLVDSFGRIRETVDRTIEGLQTEELEFRPSGTGNSIGWLVWHLARGQDAQVADVSGSPQVWPEWAEGFGLPFAVEETGYGMSSEQVGQVRGVTADQLAGYLAAVTERTVEYLRGLEDEEFDRVVDDAWDPPVTLAARLVSIIGDDLQHVGQAGYVRGLLA